MKRIPKWLKGVLVLFVLYLLFFLRLPFYLEVPGGLFSLDEMVEVDHQFTDDSGDFYITTVGIRKLTPIGLLSSIFPYRDLISEAELYGNYDDFEMYDEIQKYHMKSSINNAIKVAFDAADKEYQFEYKGVYVLRVIEESSFYEELKVGDIVEAVNGERFQSSKEFIDYIGGKNVGEEVVLEIKRDAERVKLTGELVQLDLGIPGIGIGLVDDTTLNTEPAVEIHSANIGGPSAGLMFSLDIYTKLIKNNLRGTLKIAGTGTIEADGKVGRIGGIEKKVVAADREGMDYFFVPNDQLSEEIERLNPGLQSNYEAAVLTAQKIDSSMEVIPIQSIDEAIDFLEKLDTREVSEKDVGLFELHTSKINLDWEDQVAQLLN